MSTMRALVLRSNPSSFHIEEIPTPQPKPGMARVRVASAALNRRDVWIRDGKYARIVYPVIPGSDGAGVVDAIGDEHAAAWLGREVIINPNIGWGADSRAQSASYGILGMPSQGCCAEYVCVPYDRLVDKPEHLSFAEAAALPLAGLTAYRALVTQAGVRAHEHVLVSGIGGGVALFLLQFAVARGARVFVTSTDPEKIVRAVRVGASGGVCTADPDWMNKLAAISEHLDCVIDSIGGDLMNSFLQVVKPGGRVVSYGATLGAISSLEVRRIFWKQLHWIGSTMGSDEDFHNMVELVRMHHLVPQIDAIIPFANAVEAFERITTSQQFGKIVLTMH